jgi:hypothetical protein
MMLAEALKDVLVALEVGLLHQLPNLDLSGRQLIYVEPRLHSREGYTNKSMVSIRSDLAMCLSELDESHVP